MLRPILPAAAASMLRHALRPIPSASATKLLRPTRTLATSSAPSTRPRVLILGTGWGGTKLARGLDKTKFDVRLISPANHFLFTPMLPSTAVGTLEFRAIQEPVRTIPGLSEYYQAKARHVDLDSKLVSCEGIFTGRSFDVAFDYLVVAVGNKTNTFDTPGVVEREGEEIFFLKHLHHARQIRNRVLECFERAANPTLSAAERARLLSFVVVGGGPTSCEFTTELSDFLKSDVAKWYPEEAGLATVTLVEAGDRILGPFDAALSEYYREHLLKAGIDVRTKTAVKEVWHGDDGEGHHTTRALLSDGSTLPFGAMVWSAGLAPVKFVENAGDALPTHERSKRILTDDYLRVPGTFGRVYAIGDCADVVDMPLPPTAAVAEQQGAYLMRCFNQHLHACDVRALAPDEPVPLPGPVRPYAQFFSATAFLDYAFPAQPTFRYVERGAMASMGRSGGVMQTSNSDITPGGPNITGFAAWAAWKAVYLTKQLSWSNMMLIPMYWFKAAAFGRDISRF